MISQKNSLFLVYSFLLFLNVECSKLLILLRATGIISETNRDERTYL